jgi:hypothetical protein
VVDIDQLKTVWSEFGQDWIKVVDFPQVLV